MDALPPTLSKRKSRAPSRREEDWDPVKPQIIALFSHKTLPAIVAILEEEYNFVATARQLKFQFKKWGLKKNNHSNEMRFMAMKLHQRAKQPWKRGLRFKARGKPVKRSDIERWKARSSFVYDKSAISDCGTPDGVSYGTCSPGDSNPRTPGTPHDRSPSPATVRLVEETTALCFPGDFASTLPINAYTIENGMLYSPGRSNAGVDRTSILATGGPQGDLAVGIDSFGSNSRQAQEAFLMQDIEVIPWHEFNIESPNAITPAFSEYFSNGGSPISVGGNRFVSCANLPFFQMLEKIREKWSLSSGFNSPLGGIYNQPSSPIRDVTLGLRHRLFDLLQPNYMGSASGVQGRGSNLTYRLSQLLPGYSDTDLLIRTQGYFDIENTFTLQYFFELVVFLVSNNMLDDYDKKRLIKAIEDYGCISLLTRFLRVDCPTKRAFTSQLLDAVIEEGHSDGVRVLFEAGILDCEFAMKKLIESPRVPRNKHTLQFLLERCRPSNEVLDNLLYKVARDRGSDVEIAQILINNGANVNFRGVKRTSLLRRAVERRYYALAKLLLDSGDNFQIDENYRGPIVSCLLLEDCEADPDLYIIDAGASDQEGRPYSEYFKLRLYIETKMGLRQQSDPLSPSNIVHEAEQGIESFSKFANQNGLSRSSDIVQAAFVYACKAGDIQWNPVLSTLLEYGVDPDTPVPYEHDHDNTPLKMAILAGEADLCRLLLEAGASLRERNYLSEASGVGIPSLEIIGLLIKAGADVKNEGPQAFEAATYLGNLEAAEFLLEKGSPFDAFGDYYSPLQIAARYGHLALVRRLCSMGADVNKPAKVIVNGVTGDAGHVIGETALQAACYVNSLEIVKFLLEKGVDVNPPPDRHGQTALQAALLSSYPVGSENHKRQEDLFRLLIQRGANLFTSGESPIIHLLMMASHFGLLKEVLHTGIDPNQKDKSREGSAYRKTPLQVAVSEGRMDFIRVLVDHGANVNHPPSKNYGRTPLQEAACQEVPDIAILEYLLALGADVNARAGEFGGITAIQGAAISGCIPVAQLLLDNGADVNGPPAYQEGRTALEGAAEHGRLDMIQFLLSHGAMGDVSGPEGYISAIELAEQEEHYEIVNILQAAQDSLEAHAVQSSQWSAGNQVEG